MKYFSVLGLILFTLSTAHGNHDNLRKLDMSNQKSASISITGKDDSVLVRVPKNTEAVYVKDVKNCKVTGPIFRLRRSQLS